MAAYEAPNIIEVGSIEELTQGSTGGSVSDAAFPADTPLKDITSYSG